MSLKPAWDARTSARHQSPSLINLIIHASTSTISYDRHTLFLQAKTLRTNMHALQESGPTRKDRHAIIRGIALRCAWVYIRPCWYLFRIMRPPDDPRQINDHTGCARRAYPFPYFLLLLFVVFLFYSRLGPEGWWDSIRTLTTLRSATKSSMYIYMYKVHMHTSNRVWWLITYRDE